ncbi:MAG: putative ThiF family protein [Prokaryotic dsDNA virus sp.]|nr:MAG: putative ThiF family protein [Prokaryotic dsDNA virus sp.]|tara:strand:- start:132 stop:794 length:663 start_codon:yes stop_codon:yes gene_type:complete
MEFNERSSGLVNNLHEHSFHILGCGAIGSCTAMQLRRMGADDFYLYDLDKVAIENLGVSLYTKEDVNEFKVRALKKHLESIPGNLYVEINIGMFEQISYQNRKDIVILAFDSMKARLNAVEKICADKKLSPFAMIDGRMGAEHYQQYVLKYPTVPQYNSTWYSDESGDPEPCNAKATSYCSNMSGSFISNTVRKLTTRQPYDKFISFHFPSMTMEKVLAR